VRHSSVLNPLDLSFSLCRVICFFCLFLLVLNIIHQPSNVLVDQWGCLKLADFGDGKTTTPMYCAPELFDKAQMSARSDVWALGVCFVFLSTGKVLWKRTDAAMALVMEIREFNADAYGLTSGSLASRCLQHDPMARPSATELQSAAYLNQECGLPPSWRTQLEPVPEEEEQKSAAYAAQRDRVGRSDVATAESLAVF
jgi:serine/threonine protein kinase